MNQQMLFQEQQAVDRLVPQPQYSCYAELISTGAQTVDTRIFTDTSVIDTHFYQILNILYDGIETEQVQSGVIYVRFTDNEVVKLSIFDYWFNLIFWGLPASASLPIDSRYLFFSENIDQGYIAEYINDKFLKINREKYSNIQINNMIDDVMFKFQYIDHFALYLYNTANNEDTIDLMRKDKEFYDAIHCDLSQANIEDIKDLGTQYTEKGIQRILQSGTHWAIPYFQAREGINKKQYREFQFNIGTVPNSEGGVYPRIINGNFANRGITDPFDYMIEAAKAREAQILSHKNVGESGAFARILGLNNMDDRIYPDPNYVCDSKHFVKVTIKNAKMLNMYKNRYYRFREDGIEYKMSSEPLNDNADLIGQTLLFRSPITCSCRTRGHGICYRCYGGLAKTNHDINVGRIAAELLSAMLTQRLLSAKHLLETYIKKLQWCPSFDLFFDVNFSSIRLKEDMEFKKYKIIIDQDDIDSDEDDDDATGVYEFSKYVTSFKVMDPKGAIYDIYTADEDNMYLSVETDKLLKRRGVNGDNQYIINMDDFKDSNIFFIQAQNNGLSATLKKIQNIINKKQEIAKLGTKDAVVQGMMDTIIDGGLSIDAIHVETILAHQCVSKDSNLLDPEWQYPNEQHRMISLNEALKDNPSVTVSLMHKNVGKLLFYPLTFQKSKASVLDLFYMTKPQNYMSMKPVHSNLQDDKEIEGDVKPFTINLDRKDATM